LSRRVEISFNKSLEDENMICDLYSMPRYDFIRRVEFDFLYKIATDGQRKKLEKLRKNREIEISMNINLGTLISSIESDRIELKQQKIYKK